MMTPISVQVFLFTEHKTIARVALAALFVFLLAPSLVLADPQPPTRPATTTQQSQSPLIDPAKLIQFPDSRRFIVNGRVCFGSELNGQRASDPAERKNTRSNRVINPHPLRPDAPLEWEVRVGTEVRDGAGILMGTVTPALKVGERNVPTSKFNFGMSKTLGGQVYIYAFSVPIEPTAELRKLLNPQDLADGHVRTSAWLPLADVVDNETLLQRIGLGMVQLPRVPLAEQRFRITGGADEKYQTPFGEMAIVKSINGPVPSHYLRRPSGTVNIIYSVPGFGLGGQGLDAFLVTDGVIFRPARGAKVFVQPTYFPKGHPKAGQVTDQTMTFIYGAVEVKGADPVYGWVAKETLTEEK